MVKMRLSGPEKQLEVKKSLAYGMLTGLCFGCFFLFLLWIIFQYVIPFCKQCQGKSTNNGAASAGKRGKIVQQRRHENIANQMSNCTTASSVEQGPTKRGRNSTPASPYENTDAGYSLLDEHSDNNTHIYMEIDHTLPKEEGKDPSKYVNCNQNDPCPNQESEKHGYLIMIEDGNKEYDYFPCHGAQA